MYKHALVATDGSAVATAVFQHVRQILDPEGSVTVVEVIDDVARVFAHTTPAGFEFGATALDADLAETIVEEQRPRKAVKAPRRPERRRWQPIRTSSLTERTSWQCPSSGSWRRSPRPVPCVSATWTPEPPARRSLHSLDNPT
jgi:hypothetical protein